MLGFRRINFLCSLGNVQSNIFTLNFLISVLHFLFLGGIFPTVMVLLGTRRLLSSEKAATLYCFLRNKHQKNSTHTPFLRTALLLIYEKTSHLHWILCNKNQNIPTYTPVLGPTRLSIFEKTSHLHCY